MPIALRELKKKLKSLHNRGFIKSLRVHDTGIGHTLEQLLGLSESNVALPDLGKFELKSQRLESSSLITLFTKKPDDKLNAELLDRLGYPRKSNGLKVLHQTITTGHINKQGFELCNKKDCLVILKNKKYVFSYDKNKFKKIFDKKISKGTVLVISDSKRDASDRESFHYKEAYLLKNGDFEKFLNNLYYDIRIGRYPDGRPHDHGSAFRIKKSSLKKIFKIYKKLI